MYFELGDIVDGTHTVIYVLLSTPNRALEGMFIAVSNDIVFVQVGVVKLLIQNTSKSYSWIEFDPRWSQHEVDVAF